MRGPWGVGARGHGGATEVVAGPLSQPSSHWGGEDGDGGSRSARSSRNIIPPCLVLLSLPNSLLVEFIGFLIGRSGITSPFS